MTTSYIVKPKNPKHKKDCVGYNPKECGICAIFSECFKVDATGLKIIQYKKEGEIYTEE